MPAETPAEGRSQESESQSEADIRYSRTPSGDRVELAYEIREGLEGVAPSEILALRLTMETQTAVIVNRDLERRFSLTVEASVADLADQWVRAGLEEALGGELEFEEVPEPIGTVD